MCEAGVTERWKRGKRGVRMRDIEYVWAKECVTERQFCFWVIKLNFCVIKFGKNAKNTTFFRSSDKNTHFKNRDKKIPL